MTLSAAQATVLAAALLAGALSLRERRVAPWLMQAALLLGLFAAWQVALGRLAATTSGAAERGAQVWQAERALHLPSEASVQAPVLTHPLLAEATDRYYEFVHFPAIIGALVWVFGWHRTRWRASLLSLIGVTAACALLQSVPVAPPRLIPGLGVQDTAAAGGRSVYAAGGLALPDQLTAMPSVHVGWALLVAVLVVRLGRSPWRWLVVAHPAATLLVVVVTGNHYWLDGAVAGGLLALVLTAQAAVRPVRLRLPARVST